MYLRGRKIGFVERLDVWDEELRMIFRFFFFGLSDWMFGGLVL